MAELVQEAVDSMVQSLERENIWKMQGAMFRRSASCCEDSLASMQQVHQCIQCCHALLAQAQALVTSELKRFQDRLARCTVHCNDKVKDSMDAASKELQVKQQLESCDHRHLIPSRTKKMTEFSLPSQNKYLCQWPLGIRAGIFIKKKKGNLGLLSEFYERKKKKR
ncbi:protein FAM136A-like [Echinops telfairi]|uniref:Protein FAM136A-like n=1 Tax=Echinops telfairi TaxID=9371 RepID=A0AC55DBM5_ECHTE|nr:protein FAM136A-like [Echinops telfairi]